MRPYLYATEVFVTETRRHWIQLAPWGLALIFSIFPLGYVAQTLSGRADILLTLLGFAWLALLVRSMWELLDWYYDRFVITNKRVMVISGAVTRQVAMMPLIRVTDMAYRQSPLGKALGYGTFVLESAGQDQALRTIDNLPNPRDLYLELIEEMYSPEEAAARRRPLRRKTGADSGGD